MHFKFLGVFYSFHAVAMCLKRNRNVNAVGTEFGNFLFIS